MFIAFKADICLHPEGKRVDDGNADAVKTSGNLVGALIEFTAGVKAGKNEFERAYAFPRMNAYGNSTPIVLYADDISLFKDDQNTVAKARHGLINAVIDDFIDEMMESLRSGRTDIHTRSFSYGLEAF